MKGFGEVEKEAVDGTAKNVKSEESDPVVEKTRRPSVKSSVECDRGPERFHELRVRALS